MKTRTTTNNATTTKKVTSEYIAPEIKEFNVLGVPFQAFIDENGQTVFSEIGVERGMQPEKAKGWLKSIRSRSSFPARQSQSQQALQPFKTQPFRTSKDIPATADTAQYLKTKTGRGTQTIRVITAAELLSVVSYLAERGNARAISMQEAGFAAILQQTIDDYDGIQRTHKEYNEPATQLRKNREQARVELRSITGKFTTPTFHCNVFKPNNNLLFGEGYNRDSYKEDDRQYRLMLEGVLESIQYGLKMAGLPLEQVINISHARVQEMLDDKQQAAKVSQIKQLVSA